MLACISVGTSVQSICFWVSTAGKAVKLKELQRHDTVTWYGGILFLSLLPCTSELHIVLSGNNGVHVVIKCVCTFPWPILVLFKHLFSSFSLNTRSYFPSPLMPSILVHYLSLPSKTFPALEKSGMVWV